MDQRPAMFSRRTSKVRALVLSAVACLAALALVLPSGASVSMAAVYANSAAKAHGSTVSGKFTTNGKSPLKGQKVSLVFKDARGHVVRRETVTLNKQGKFDDKAPKGAAKVTIQTSKGGVKVNHTFQVRKGKDLEVTAVVPRKGSGILPGIFPY
jgi:hypothetical protein